MPLDRKMFLFRRINQIDELNVVHYQATWIYPFNLVNMHLNPVKVDNAWDARLFGNVKIIWSLQILVSGGGIR